MNEKGYFRRYYEENIRKYTQSDLDDNFKIVKEPYHLTSKGFNEISKISTFSYCSQFNCKWCDVVESYGKQDELYTYILNEFRRHYLKNYDSSVSKFGKNHKYISIDVVLYFSISRIKMDSGFNSVLQRHNLEGLTKNFYEIKEKIGKIPFHSEFKENSRISIQSYLKYFEIPNYDYDEIVRRIVIDEEELEEYFQLKHKRTIENASVGGTKAGEANALSDKELEVEFRRVFDEYYHEYGFYPTRRAFEKYSKISEITYRKRFNTSFKKVHEYYGYITNSKFKRKSEKEVLILIAKILNTTFESQKCWDWLVSDKGASLPCDGYYPKYNLIVEYDGPQHREPVKVFGGDDKFIRQIDTDKQKDYLLMKHGYKLIRIPSNDDWRNESYLINKLRECGIDVEYNACV